MKDTVLTGLREFKESLQSLRREVRAMDGDRVSRLPLRQRAESAATRWVEELRSPLEHKFRLPADVIQSMSDAMKQLHILSRPNNRKSSYIKVLGEALQDFDDRLILPIQQSATQVESLLDLQKLIPGFADPAESDYLQEAVSCSAAGFNRAAIVLGWCATIDKMQRKIQLIGLGAFNAASSTLKAQTSGKFKRWNKEFSVTSLSELQTVFDTDLIVVLEGMQLVDGNQAQRLETCFQYRNHSAHPGQAPIDEPHVIAFFSDINSIVLQNPAFAT
jgi:hypothetical protein